jgi:hypothetical protein
MFKISTDYFSPSNRAFPDYGKANRFFNLGSVNHNHSNVQCNFNNFWYKNACLVILDHSFFSDSMQSVTNTGCCRLLNSPFRHNVISYREIRKRILFRVRWFKIFGRTWLVLRSESPRQFAPPPPLSVGPTPMILAAYLSWYKLKTQGRGGPSKVFLGGCWVSSPVFLYNSLGGGGRDHSNELAS